ncbi:LPS assembly protein LptD, partial [Cobetia marina]
RGDEGTLEGAWLADDDGGSDPDDDEEDLIGEDRWYINYQHSGRYDARTAYQLKYGAASDGNYFDDFGRNFGETETDSLERLARLNYRGDVWDLEFKAQGYQRMDFPLDDEDKPFYRLPSLTANARWSQTSGFYEEWNSNATYFWRDVDETDTDIDDDEAANGTRLRLAPAVGW